MSTHPKPPSQRQLRVGEEIRHVLAEIFIRGEWDALGGSDYSVTVSEVKLSPDLKNATAYVMPLGGQNSEAVMQALIRSASYFRKLVSARMKLRYAPRLHFRFDHSFDEAHRIERLLRTPEVARDLETKNSEE